MARDPHPHYVNEALNRLGRSRCTSNSECDGFRTCSYAGWCQGQAGVEGKDYNVKPKKTVHHAKVTQLTKKDAEIA